MVLALTLDAVEALARGHVADGLGDAALAYLAGDEIVDAVLEGVDLGDAGYFCFVEVFWEGRGWLLVGGWERGRKGSR